jgi:hypothetical protein
MANALLDVQHTYTSLDAQYNMLRAACVDDDQRNALADQYAAAELAYDKCVGQMLEDDDAEVAALSTQLQAANAVVDKSVEQMGNMSKVIDNITNALTIGAQLAAKVGL